MFFLMQNNFIVPAMQNLYRIFKTVFMAGSISHYVIPAIIWFVDENKRSLSVFLCSSTSICAWHPCHLCRAQRQIRIELVFLLSASRNFLR